MTAGEDQTQSVIRIFHRLLKQLGLIIWMQSLYLVFKFSFFVALCLLTANRVEQFSMSYCCQPSSGILWRAFLLPGCGSGSECFLQGLFRQIKGAGQTDQGCNDPSVFLAKDLLECLRRRLHVRESYTLFPSHATWLA